MSRQVHGVVSGRGGVVCSDGRTVVRTDADGSFSFEANGPFVFVCVPSGYIADRWFVPVEDEPRFELRPQSQPVPFSFAQITDLHGALDRWVFDQPAVSTPEVVGALLDEIAGRDGLAFVVSTGDQTNDGTEDEFAAFVKTAAESRLPVISIPGNHDHNSVDIAAAARDGAAFGPGVFYTPYDRWMGPRWFSFDHGGVHFVTIDWTTYHLGAEVEVQESWVRADLACVEAGTPVIFLTHDLMSTAFFEKVGASPAASLSGHWHTSRVVRAGGALHVNTAPPTYGGLDYTAPQWRVVTWDGTTVSIETVERGPALRPDRSTALWTASLGAPAHRAGPVVAGDVVVAATSDDDAPAGSVQAFDAATGELRWRADLGSAVKATPLVYDGRVVACAVTGETVCVDLATGAERWRVEIDDPLRLWTYLRPSTDGRRVFVGDTARFVALDLDDGSVVWSRDDLGVRGNITCHAHPAVVDGVLMVAFAAQVPDMWALDAATSATLWPKDVAGASIYDLDGEALITHLPRGPVSGFGRDPHEADVYAVRLGNRIDRIRTSDGTIVWSATVEGWFNPATPVVDGEDVYVCLGIGSVVCLARSDGSVRWRTSVTAGSPRQMGPYRADGGVLLGEVALTEEHAIVACGDGRVVWLSRDSGAIVREIETGVTIAAAVAVDASRCYALGTDGVLFALPG